MEDSSAIQRRPILVEPFVPPRSPRRAPSRTRVPILSTATTRPLGYVEDPLRHASAENSPTDIGPRRSQSPSQPLGIHHSQLVLENATRPHYWEHPKRGPNPPDSSREGYYDYDVLPTVPVDESPLLISPPPPKQQPLIATQLPTVPIPLSPFDRPWLKLGGRFMSRFEPVPVKALIIHTFLCCVSFPFVYLLCTAASGISLFWCRAVVGAICGTIGLALGYNLMKLSQRGMETVLWATIIHESMHPDGGITLEELNDYVSDHGSVWAAIRLLFGRTFYHKGARRTRRRRYDQTPWTLFTMLFLLAAVIAACLVFIFGRIVDIYTQQERQLAKYHETTVIGDLSAEDIERAVVLADQAYS
ncbi:hypothetical protein FS749_011137, partial [Ceratobasidium sp. UAMH 11750]